MGNDSTYELVAETWAFCRKFGSVTMPFDTPDRSPAPLSFASPFRSSALRVPPRGPPSSVPAPAFSPSPLLRRILLHHARLYHHCRDRRHPQRTDSLSRLVASATACISDSSFVGRRCWFFGSCQGSRSCRRYQAWRGSVFCGQGLRRG